MFLLLISLAALFLGILSASMIVRYGRFLAFLDGFLSIFVGALVLFHIFPHSFSEVGYWAVPLFLLGCIIPVFLESFGTKTNFAIVLIALAFSIHGFLDGVGLQLGASLLEESHKGHTHGDGHNTHALSLAVIAHRIPMGLFLGFAAMRMKSFAYILAAIIALATFAGFAWGAKLPAMEGLQALLGGGLMHVITGHSFLENVHPKEWTNRIVGAVFAGCVMMCIAEVHAESLFLDIWNIASLLFLVLMTFQVPQHECITCEEPETL